MDNSPVQVLTPPHPFSLFYTLKCGQIFGWKMIDSRFLGSIRETPICLEQTAHRLLMKTNQKSLTLPRIGSFFRWDDPLETIAAQWKQDQILSEAYRRFQGLRLIRQDPWECLVRFILSIFSNIPKIERTLENLARYAGREIRFLNHKLCLIPGAPDIAGICENTLRTLGMGFRAPYLRSCAKKIAAGFSLHSLKNLPYSEARGALMELPGIGEKVADCILLFSLDHVEAFPVDVWMKRVLEQGYFSGQSKTERYLSEWGKEKFAPFAGYAQQYLYHFARTTHR